MERGSAPQKPPPLAVEEDAFRHDIVSTDMRRVHPDLPVHGTAEDRHDHLRRCDLAAYNGIRASFPNFTPPGERREETRGPRSVRGWSALEEGAGGVRRPAAPQTDVCCPDEAQVAPLSG